MIKVHRLGGQEVSVNADHIESVEPIPDTMIKLTNGNRLVVRESVAEVTDLIALYRRQVGSQKSGQNLSQEKPKDDLEG